MANNEKFQNVDNPFADCLTMTFIACGRDKVCVKKTNSFILTHTQNILLPSLVEG